MTLTYYKANADGTIGSDTLTDGGINELFTPITVAQLTNGANIKDKFFIEPDVDGSMYIGVGEGSMFPTYIFQSANDNDSESDLTGNEDRYTGATVTDNPDGTTLKVNDDPNYTVWRAGDTIMFPNGSTAVIDSASSSSGVTTLTMQTDVGTNHAGEWITAVILINMTASNDYPVWVEQIVPANSSTGGNNYNTVTFAEMY